MCRTLAWFVLTLLLAAAAAAPARAEKSEQSKDKPPTEAKEPESIDFRELKKLLPKELLGLPRASLEGEMASNESAARSSATASYEKAPPAEDAPKPDRPAAPPGRIEVQYMDHGTAPGMAESAGAWSKTDRDEQNEGGYTRTYQLAGFPAIESYSNEAKSGTLQVFVAKRIIVTVIVEYLPPESLKKAGEALPLRQVADLVK